MLCESLRDRIQPWLRDYDRLQSLAVILLYIQVRFCLSNSSKPEKQGFQSISITDCSICIGWVCIGGIAGSTVQRGVADKSGDCIVRSGSNREQQSEPRPYICRPSRLHRLPRCLLVHSLFPRNMVNLVSFQFIFQTKPCIYHIHFPSLYESLSVIS